MKITQLRKDDFYLPILRTLDELGGSGSVEEIDNRVIELTELGEDDLALRYEKSNALMVPDKISWGRSYLRMAGLIQSETKGLWVLTEEGRNALKEGPGSVQARVTQAVKDYQKAYNASKAERKAATSVNIEIGGDEAEADWADQLLSKVQSMDPYAFERLS
jgi:restriction system protein